MNKSLIVVALLACAGCFTLHETEYPVVNMCSGEGKDIAVQLAGFEATVTSYIPVYGYETINHFGYSGRHHPGYWGTTTVQTETYIPQTSATSAFLDRATEALETSGFSLKTDKPQYRVEVKFNGPSVTDGDRMVTAAWVLLSALSADYAVQTWTAKLRIYDIASGKLLMNHDYTQRYQTVVWGPIPIFSPTGSSKTSGNAIQSWCLTALTDRAMADATACLTSLK